MEREGEEDELIKSKVSANQIPSSLQVVRRQEKGKTVALVRREVGGEKVLEGDTGAQMEGDEMERRGAGDE